MAEAALIPSDEGASVSTQETRNSDDGIRIHPHVFSVPTKRSRPPDFRKQLRKRRHLDNESKDERKLADEFSDKLSQSREHLLTTLEAPALSDASSAVSRALEGYVGQLLVFFDYATAGESTGMQPQLRPIFRDAVAFEWQDILLSSQTITVPDVVFELASTIIAVCAWRLRRAAHLCKDTRAGVDSSQSSQAYKLILLAAGGFKYAQDSCAPLLAASCPSSDCTDQAASTFLHICLADAQAITTLRAMAKNNAPSLVASLAVDTAALYRSAATAAGQAPFVRQGAKGLQYAEYKAATFRSYACCFAGLARLKDGQAGQAVRLLEESKVEARRSLPLAAAYNKAEPSTPAADHAEFDRDLGICVEAAFARAKNENDHVYYQRPPEDLPPLPEPRRLVNATALQLPQAAEGTQEFASLLGPSMPVPDSHQREDGKPAAIAEGATVTPAAASPSGGAEASSPPHATEQASCWRWLLVAVSMPVLAVISVVGLIIWLILLPVKVICCPIGCLIQLMADVVEKLLKAPFKAILWASGKPYKAPHPEKEKS